MFPQTLERKAMGLWYIFIEAAGPSSFYRADRGAYGLDRDTAESKKAAAGLFSVMLGTEIDADILDTAEYGELIKPISAFMWITGILKCRIPGTGFKMTISCMSSIGTPSQNTWINICPWNNTPSLSIFDSPV